MTIGGFVRHSTCQVIAFPDSVYSIKAFAWLQPRLKRLTASSVPDIHGRMSKLEIASTAMILRSESYVKDIHPDVVGEYENRLPRYSRKPVSLR